MTKRLPGTNLIAAAILICAAAPAFGQSFDVRSLFSRSPTTTGTINSAPAPQAPAQGEAPPEWSGESGSSGDPSMTADAIRAAIGVFVLVALWAPRLLLLGARPRGLPERRRFLVLGGLAGFLNTTVGASGPMQGPFFHDMGLTRHGIVGTFAACQVLGHSVKIALFAAAGYSVVQHAPALLVLGGCVFAGTLVGSRLLERVPEPAFVALYRGALTLLALRLAVWEPFVQPLLVG